MKSKTIIAACAAFVLVASNGLFASGSQEGAVGQQIEEIEIMWQQEVTEEFWTNVIPVYEQQGDAVPVNFNLTPKAYEQIRFRLTSGDAPDIFFTWASEFDFIGAIESEKLYPVDEVLSAPNASGDGTLGDTLFQAGLELGLVDGSHYLLPVGKLLASMYYDAAFFEANDYEVPSNQADFLRLAERVKSDHDMPLIIYAGAYPFMLSDALIWPLIANESQAAVDALNSNEPGAWTADAVVEALQFVEEMAQNGYISKDSVAMDHIQSQIEFINHNAAIVPSGTWLEGEMADQWPADFELTPLAAPSENDEGSVVAITEAMVLPVTNNTEAKLPHIIDLVQLFYSDEIARENMLSADYVMGLDTVPESVMSQLPSSVPETWQIASREGVTVLSPEYRFKYKEVFVEYNNKINALVLGDISAREMAEEMESIAARHR